ncbi:MAG: murein hydrolase activator EnvC family protein, partial [Nitrospinaceae bacterium]
MKVSFFTKWTLGLAAGWLMAVPLAWSGPGSGKTIETLLQEEKTELEELKRKISRQDQELSKIGRQETSLLKTLGRLDDRLGLRERELRIYEWNIQINKKQIKKVALQLAAMEQRLQQQKKTLGARLRSMYKQGGLLPVRILFSAESPGSLLRRFEYLERVMSYDAAVFRGYQSRLHRLREERLALLEVKNNLIRFEKAAQSKKQELEKEARAKSAFLKKVVSQKKYTRQARKEFVQASENLNQLVARLQEKLVIGEGLSLADRKGRLRPPVPGSIITRFGRTKDPGIGTFVVHNGIDFKVPSGTP